MIDNSELLKEWGFLHFSEDDDFYFIKIIQRKKEHPHLGKNSHIIKDYYIKSIEQFDKCYPEIIQLCESFNARAQFWINKRSSYRIAIETAQLLLEQIKSNTHNYSHRAYAKTTGQSSKSRYWIIDIDEKDNIKYNIELPFILKLLQPIGEKIITKIPTKAGYHYISYPFNLKEFSELYPEIDIHKDNFTNLYCV